MPSFFRYPGKILLLGLALCLGPGGGSLAQLRVSSPPPAKSAGPQAEFSGSGTALAAPGAEAAGPETVEVRPIALRASLIKTNDYPIDLATVLRLVAEQNLVIAQSRKNTEILQSRLRQSQVSFLPSITASLSQNWQYGRQGNISGAGGGFVSSAAVAGGSSGGGGGGGRSGMSNAQRFVQTQAGASWTVYPGGRNLYQMLADRRRKASADFQLRETTQEQLANAALDYYKLLAAYQQKGVVVRSIINATEQVRANEAKVAVGKGIPLDLSQAKTNYAQQQSNLIQAESTILTAEQNLLNRLNLDPAVHLIPGAADTLKRPLVPDAFSVEKLVAQAVSVNPSIRSGAEDLN